MLVALTVALGTLVAFEPIMTLVHRLVFHGPLWCSHKSHHEYPTARRIVRNDLLWLWPLLVSAAALLRLCRGACLGLGGRTPFVKGVQRDGREAHLTPEALVLGRCEPLARGIQGGIEVRRSLRVLGSRVRRRRAIDADKRTASTSSPPPPVVGR